MCHLLLLPVLALLPNREQLEIREDPAGIGGWDWSEVNGQKAERVEDEREWKRGRGRG